MGNEIAQMGVKFRPADAYNEKDGYVDRDLRFGDHESTQ